jgi:hypothetical protein
MQWVWVQQPTKRSAEKKGAREERVEATVRVPYMTSLSMRAPRTDDVCTVYPSLSPESRVVRLDESTKRFHDLLISGLQLVRKVHFLSKHMHTNGIFI